MLLLVLALVSQAPGNDIPFCAAVERFVADRPGCTPAATLQEPELGLLAGLGDSHWRDRERASQAICERSGHPLTLRLLLWGEMSEDAEVRLRSETLLGTLYRCWLCKGVGLCGTCGGLGWFDAEHGEACKDCHWRNPQTNQWMCRACNGSGEPQKDTQ